MFSRTVNKLKMTKSNPKKYFFSTFTKRSKTSKTEVGVVGEGQGSTPHPKKIIFFQLFKSYENVEKTEVGVVGGSGVPPGTSKFQLFKSSENVEKPEVGVVGGSGVPPGTSKFQLFKSSVFVRFKRSMARFDRLDVADATVVVAYRKRRLHRLRILKV